MVPASNRKRAMDNAKKRKNSEKCHLQSVKLLLSSRLFIYFFPVRRLWYQINVPIRPVRMSRHTKPPPPPPARKKKATNYKHRSLLSGRVTEFPLNSCNLEAGSQETATFGGSKHLCACVRVRMCACTSVGMCAGGRACGRAGVGGRAGGRAGGRWVGGWVSAFVGNPFAGRSWTGNQQEPHNLRGPTTFCDADHVLAPRPFSSQSFSESSKPPFAWEAQPRFWGARGGGWHPSTRLNLDQQPPTHGSGLMFTETCLMNRGGVNLKGSQVHEQMIMAMPPKVSMVSAF